MQRIGVRGGRGGVTRYHGRRKAVQTLARADSEGETREKQGAGSGNDIFRGFETELPSFYWTAN